LTAFAGKRGASFAVHGVASIDVIFDFAPQPRGRLFGGLENVWLEQPLIEKHAPNTMVAQKCDLAAAVFA
jgi:hypothetical protein